VRFRLAVYLINPDRLRKLNLRWAKWSIEELREAATRQPNTNDECACALACDQKQA